MMVQQTSPPRAGFFVPVVRPFPVVSGLGAKPRLKCYRQPTSTPLMAVVHGLRRCRGCLRHRSCGSPIKHFDEQTDRLAGRSWRGFPLLFVEERAFNSIEGGNKVLGCFGSVTVRGTPCPDSTRPAKPSAAAAHDRFLEAARQRSSSFHQPCSAPELAADRAAGGVSGAALSAVAGLACRCVAERVFCAACDRCTGCRAGR